jgi:hypothetical protein
MFDFHCSSAGAIFSTKHQVLKNSLNGKISIDFGLLSLKFYKNFESYENEL